LAKSVMGVSTFCGRAHESRARERGECGVKYDSGGRPGAPAAAGWNQLPTTKQTLVVPLPPMFSVATRLAFSTW